MEFCGPNNGTGLESPDQSPGICRISKALLWEARIGLPLSGSCRKGKLRCQSYIYAPSETDIEAAKGALRYLEFHSNFGITLAENMVRGLELFTDIAHQDNQTGNQLKHITIVVFAGAPIVWTSKKLSVVDSWHCHLQKPNSVHPTQQLCIYFGLRIKSLHSDCEIRLHQSRCIQRQ